MIKGKGNRQITADEHFLIIKSDNEPKSNWKDIQSEYKKLNPNLNIIYFRFALQEGHIVVFSENELIDFIHNFTFQDTNYTIKLCDESQFNSFWKEHGYHYETCVKNFKKQEKKKNQEKKEDKTKNHLKREVKLGKQR